MTAIADPLTTAILGDSPAIRAAILRAHRFARGRAPILLIGETGTGKEVFAQEIHRWAGEGGRLVAVDCGALPRELAESQLFGHRRGAFTGAVDHSTGLIEVANGGTLFLDEVENLLPELQAKLLRVLDTGQFRRVGETDDRRSAFRTIAAAPPTLRAAMVHGRFRHDLYQRLAAAVVELPPLAARGDDAVLLAHHYAASIGRVLDPSAEEVVRRHVWPGNVRELRHTIGRAALLAEVPTLTAELVAQAVDGAVGLVMESSSSRLRDELLAQCEAAAWDRHRIAAALGVRKTKLYTLLHEAGISLREGRRSLQLRQWRGRSHLQPIQ